MSTEFALSAGVEEPHARHQRERLSALSIELEQRERHLTDVKVELQTLQGQYLQAVGALYSELGAIEAEIAAAAGTPDGRDDDGRAPDASPMLTNAETQRLVASETLKKVFRDVAKAIHPDLALDEPARCRRHSLMAEANRAYAERDEDRLRLILGAWERDPDVAEGVDAACLPVSRRMALIEDRLRAIDEELAALAESAVNRLKRKIDETRAQGWDLMAEMVLQVKREIALARAKLAAARTVVK